MNRDEIFSVLLAGINDFGGREYAAEEIDRTRPVFDFGVDSLNVMQILAEVEASLRIEIDLAELSENDLASVDSLLEFLHAASERSTPSV